MPLWRHWLLDGPDTTFMIRCIFWPPSSSGLGYLVLSQGTGVRVPVGVLQQGRFVRQRDPRATSASRGSSNEFKRRFLLLGGSTPRPMIAIELYGVPRLRAGTHLVRLDASTI